ncbi:MAG: hypothetical protein KIT40_12260 [Nitrospira sp.]|nr:hypothetical protein [Nitrospira sp.]
MVTRLVHIVLLIGLLVAGVVLLMLGIGDRPNEETAATTPGSQRLGRSTLSHGGPGAGSLSDNSPRLPAGGRDGSSQ